MRLSGIANVDDGFMRREDDSLPLLPVGIRCRVLNLQKLHAERRRATWFALLGKVFFD